MLRRRVLPYLLIFIAGLMVSPGAIEAGRWKKRQKQEVLTILNQPNGGHDVKATPAQQWINRNAWKRRNTKAIEKLSRIDLKRTLDFKRKLSSFMSRARRKKLALDYIQKLKTFPKWAKQKKFFKETVYNLIEGNTSQYRNVAEIEKRARVLYFKYQMSMNDYYVESDFVSDAVETLSKVSNVGKDEIRAQVQYDFEKDSEYDNDGHGFKIVAEASHRPSKETPDFEVPGQVINSAELIDVFSIRLPGQLERRLVAETISGTLHLLPELKFHVDRPFIETKDSKKELRTTKELVTIDPSDPLFYVNEI